jgi:hypothetical protein
MVPPAVPVDHGPAGTGAPLREDLERLPRRAIKDGRSTKADVYEVDFRGRSLVIKDYAGRAPWFRWFGRIQVARECRAYRVLSEDPGLVPFVGRVDAWALAFGRIDAVPLVFARSRFADGVRHVQQLRALIDRLHARGVAHLDLRGRENILLDRDGRVRIVDLAGSIVLRPGSLAHRCLFPALVVFDESAFLKWKRLLAPHRMTRVEMNRLRRFGRFVRPLWPLNRKRSGGRGSIA